MTSASAIDLRTLRKKLCRVLIPVAIGTRTIKIRQQTSKI